MLPELVGRFGVLPVGVHRATMAEVKDLFVDRAPESTQRRRRWIFEALELHMQVVFHALQGEPVRVWIDGGFTTHKSWKPEDVDVVYLTSFDGVRKLSHDRGLPLWTLADVKALSGRKPVETEKLHPMAGLLDGYADKDNDLRREYWSRKFRTFKGQDGRRVDGVEKGFVEVILDD